MSIPTPTGQTALISGASGGIGEALARVFARNRFDLVLVARTEHKLQALADVLVQEHGIRARVLVADLTDPTAPQGIADWLAAKSIVVDALVKNAGFATYGPFIELDLKRELELLQVNIVALSHFSRLLLPGMVARRRGRVLNVASTAAFMPGPLMADYYASKAFVLSLSEALNNELGGTGVTVTALCPGPTRTGFQARAQMEQSKLVRGRTIMDAATVAEVGFAALMRGQAVVIPGLLNRIQTLLPRLLPRRLVPRIVRQAQERTH